MYGLIFIARIQCVNGVSICMELCKYILPYNRGQTMGVVKHSIDKFNFRHHVLSEQTDNRAIN